MSSAASVCQSMSRPISPRKIRFRDSLPFYEKNMTFVRLSIVSWNIKRPFDIAKNRRSSPSNIYPRSRRCDDDNDLTPRYRSNTVRTCILLSMMPTVWRATVCSRWTFGLAQSNLLSSWMKEATLKKIQIDIETEIDLEDADTLETPGWPDQGDFPV